MLEAEKAVRRLVGLWTEQTITGDELRLSAWIVAVELSREQAIKYARALIESRGSTVSVRELYAAGVGYLAKSLRDEEFEDFDSAVTRIHTASGVGVSTELQAMIDILRLAAMVKKGTLQRAEMVAAVNHAYLETPSAFNAVCSEAVASLADQTPWTKRYYTFGAKALWRTKMSDEHTFDHLVRHIWILLNALSTRDLMINLVEEVDSTIRDGASVVLNVLDGSEDALMVTTSNGVFRVVVTRIDKVK